jgi:hypothetical protein
MKKLILILFGLAAMGMATAQQQGNHWTPVGLELNMTVNGIILIDEEEQTLATLEVGAFCGDECRGSRKATYFGMTGQYVVPLQIQGNTNGEVITFRLYDHDTQQELDLRSINTLEFESNGRLGTPGNWYPFAFMTPVIPVGDYHFVTEGNWSQASNWIGGTLPGPGDEVFIDASCLLDRNAVVATLTVTEGQTLTLQSGKTLTVTGDLINTSPAGLVIKDGAQLLHACEGVSATVKKNVTGYGYFKGKYYFISNPLMSSVNPETASVNHLTSGNYDLYRWLVDNPDELEWRNYKTNTFLLSPDATAYLYANRNSVELSFPGVLRPSLPYYSKPVSLVVGNEYHTGGWNLVGNPFVCNAYLVDEGGAAMPYYKMNAEGNGIEAVTSGVIAPMQGVFYEASGNGYVYFTRTAPAKGESSLELSVYQGGDAIDNVIIRFDEGRSLKKQDFNEDKSQLFIQQDGKDYAVACANGVGEMPVSFKAKENGSYMLSFNIENVEFSYLHLIDILTGEDIDLLALRQAQGPQATYTFEATTTDTLNRFKVVYVRAE